MVENKRIEWNEVGDIERNWEDVQEAIDNTTRKVCGSEGVGKKEPKLWNGALGAAPNVLSEWWRWKEDAWKFTEKKRELLKGVYFRAKGS